MTEKRYQQVYRILKSGIQQTKYPVGAYLPSENDLCKAYSITRTTARRALDELLKDGFIEKEHGKGSRVVERRQSLGLLTVKGFSEAVGENVQTSFLQYPKLCPWPGSPPFPVSKVELADQCIYFERLRGVAGFPVMRECNWIPAKPLPGFLGLSFVDDSFFKTLSNKCLIEITSSAQELRACFADQETAELLNINQTTPILQISVKFTTTNPQLNIYSFLYCNTEKFPIGNLYTH